MTLLYKLSVELLHKAWVRVECAEANVFAIMGNKSVIGTLRKYISALDIPNSSYFNLWERPLVIVDTLDDRSLVFACKTCIDNNQYDYIKALKNIVKFCPDQKYKYTDRLSDKDVCGLQILIA